VDRGAETLRLRAEVAQLRQENQRLARQLAALSEPVPQGMLRQHSRANGHRLASRATEQREAGSMSTTNGRRSPWAGLKRELSEWRQAATAWNRQALETHRRVQELELEVHGLRAEVLDLNLRMMVKESLTDDLLSGGPWLAAYRGCAY
jgi:hypothetical protein